MEKNISQPFDQEMEEAVLGHFYWKRKQWPMQCLFCERRCFVYFTHNKSMTKIEDYVPVMEQLVRNSNKKNAAQPQEAEKQSLPEIGNLFTK